MIYRKYKNGSSFAELFKDVDSVGVPRVGDHSVLTLQPNPKFFKACEYM